MTTESGRSLGKGKAEKRKDCDYSRARDEMFAATDTPWAPWYVARSDDKRRVRPTIISHLLSRIDYERQPRTDRAATA
jgi:polyphosphate kinase 2 (PPK2 family)